MKATPVIFGEVLFDCFEDGSQVLGGAPFNVAWHLQAFGCAPLLVSRVGDDDPGNTVLERMRQWGMDTRGMQRDPVHTTGEVRVSLDNGQPDFEILADRAWDHIDAGALPGVQPALLYQGTLARRHAVSAGALDALQAAQAAPVFLDVNLRPPWWERPQVLAQLELARWVKINDDELRTLLQRNATLEELAEDLVAAHRLALLIVTRGASGAFALSDTGELTRIAPAGETTVVDTVGAGDAFASVCILGLLRDWPVERVMERAQRFASQVVGQRGATAQDQALYAPLVREWQLTA